MNEWPFPAWDPVLLEIKDPIHLRWYGLMFLLAFVLGQLMLQRLARARFLPIKPQQVSDLIFWLVIGVLAGGRLGYSLFYQPELWNNPLEVLEVWRGGLSFHGGLIGVTLTVWLYARKHGIPSGTVGDSCAIAVPWGIACVRFANFVNGELYGRVITGTDGPPWAMRFPTEERALELLGVIRMGKRMQELAVQKAVHGPWPGMPKELEAVPAWDTVKDQVPLRHPSQIYELLGEGVFVGLLMLGVYLATRKRPLGTWAYSGVFLVGYGVVRFVIEWYRQPDRQFEDRPGELGTVLWGLSMGRVLCAGMIIAGVLTLIWRGPKRRELADVAAE